MKLAAFLAAILFIPLSASAQTDRFVFTTDSQSVPVGAVSSQITLQSQDSTGASTPITNTVCIHLTSSATQGQFSSSATNWNAVSVLTMSKNTSNRSFYYKDTVAGNRTLTAKAALKPESESRTCANWPLEEWGDEWTATHTITIGEAGQGQEVQEEETPTPTATTTTQTHTQSISTSNSYIAPPATPLFADGGDDRTVIVGADTDFFGRAYNRKQEIVDQVRFAWNFGDGTTAEGPAISHRYDYPGRYAVVLTIAQDRSAASDFIVVTAEPAKLGFTMSTDGSVSIENLAGRDLNLSNWQIRSFSRVFSLPPDTVVLRGSSLRLSAKTLNFPVGPQTELLYPNGLKALVAGEKAESATPTLSAGASTAQKAPQMQITAATPKKQPVATKKITLQVTEAEATVTDAAEISVSAAQIASASAVPRTDTAYWWLGALAMALVAFAGAVAAKRYSRQEWKVIEQSDEEV